MAGGKTPREERECVDKVVATPEALAFIETLKAKYGPSMIFHQSGWLLATTARPTSTWKAR
jgi:uncharacterized protein (DUF779 family)